MIKPWINLFIAAIFETGWTYALKYMNFSALKEAYGKDTLWSESVGIQLMPFVLYVILVEVIFIFYKLLSRKFQQPQRLLFGLPFH